MKTTNARGEQLVLRALMTGEKLLKSARWHGLCPADFAHPLHGRIYRHARALANRAHQVKPLAVYESMCVDRDTRPAREVAEYLRHLAGGDPRFSVNTEPALLAFQTAFAAQRAARETTTEGSAGHDPF